MAEETIFSKIIRREIPSDIVYQDELVTAFRDISPQAPTHILIIPNILIPTVNDVKTEHEVALGRMTVAAKIAEQEGIAEDGYRLIMNCNRAARKFIIFTCICWVDVLWGRCWHIKVFDMLKGVLQRWY
jgi:histidine triad (HIT) family protein